MINIQTDDFGNINFSNLEFNGNNTEANAIKVEDNKQSSYGTVAFDSLSIKNSDFKHFKGFAIIDYDAKNRSRGANLTVKNFLIENSILSNNILTEDKNDQYDRNSNDGTIFKIDAEVSKLHNVDITNNETEKSLFSLTTGLGEFTCSNIVNNKSTQGIMFDAQTFTGNESYENYGTLRLETLNIESNEVNNQSSINYGTINIQRYKKIESFNNRFINNKTDGNGGAMAMSASGGAAVGVPLNTPANFIDKGSLYKGNKSDNNGGALYFAGVNADISNTIFENNSAEYGSAIYFSSYAQYNDLNLNNVTFKNNKGTNGALYLNLTNNEYNQDDVNFNVNISADNQYIIWNGNSDNNGKGNDIIVNFNGSESNAVANINLYSMNGGVLQLSDGISTERRRNSDAIVGTANINIGNSNQESSVFLGSESNFNGLITNFNVRSGSFTLLQDAKLVWKNHVSESHPETGKFLVANGSSFNVHLNSVSEDNVEQHVDLAPIDLGGNNFTMEAGSNLNISINNVAALKDSSEEGWLVVAANAKLTEETDPNITFADENWLYDFSDGQKLQQGMTTSDQQSIAGTEDNIYVGYKMAEIIHPDEDAVKLTNATSHFAVSAIRSISGAVTDIYRPKHANTLWVLPQYIHDNRDTDDLGVGFDAQLRAITVGNDFVFDNGYWGFGIGYGDGNIHSNGGIAYTNGDIQSLWGIGYFKYLGDEFDVYADISYLYQDADQEQRNIVGPLYTNTTNDVFLANLGVSKDILISKKDLSQWIITPSVGLEYIYLKQRDFDIHLENDTTILHGDDSGMNILSIPVEANLQYDFAYDDLRHNFHLTLGVSKNIGDKSMSGDYTDLNGNNADKWTLIPVDDYQGKVGLGYTLYSPTENVSVDLGVNYVFSNSRELTDVTGTIKYNW